MAAGYSWRAIGSCSCCSLAAVVEPAVAVAVSVIAAGDVAVAAGHMRRRKTGSGSWTAA